MIKLVGKVLKTEKSALRARVSRVNGLIKNIGNFQMKCKLASLMGLGETIINVITQPIVIISAVFWAVAFILAKILGKKKDRITIAFPFLVLLRSKVFNRMFRKIGSKHKKFWRIWFNIGAIVSFILMLGALYFFISNFFQLIFDPKPENAILPLIPGVTISFPMFSYLLLPILINLTFHEFSHAIAAEVDGVQVKSSGIMGAGIFAIIGFGAFVEVDDFQIYNREVDWKTRIRTYAGGIWSNIIIAGIFLLLLNFSPQLTQIGYSRTTFQVDHVLSAAEGGFNENNIEIGDIAYAINGTRLDYEKGITLNAFLANETDIKFQIGDDMQITCLDPESGDQYERIITLGHRSYVGLEYANISNSVVQISKVYTTTEGGNNMGKIPENTEFSRVNNLTLDYAAGITFDWMLTQIEVPGQLNLTATNGTIYPINVNYLPKAAGTYLFNDVYLGILYEKEGDQQVKLTEVLRNDTEYGINEGLIPEKTSITQVNGIAIDLTNATFPEWLLTTINPQAGETIRVTDTEGNEYMLNVGELPVVNVYIGIISSTYALPSNFLGRLFGGNFPAQFETFLSYTVIVAFSLALFNLLPTAIFDGGRMVKELLDKIIGSKEKADITQKLHYQFNPKEEAQHLMLHNITKVVGVYQLQPRDPVPGQSNPPRGKIDPENYDAIPMDFETIDDYGNGYIEKIKPLGTEDLAPKTLMQVEVEYIADLKAPLKNKIYKSISWVVGGLVLASFLISIVKFGNTLFWL